MESRRSSRAHERVLRSIVRPALGVSLLAGIAAGGVALGSRAPFDPLVGCGGQNADMPPPGTAPPPPGVQAVGMVPADPTATAPTGSSTSDPVAPAPTDTTPAIPGTTAMPQPQPVPQPPPAGTSPAPGFAPGVPRAAPEKAPIRPTRPTRRATDPSGRALRTGLVGDARRTLA